MLPWLVGYEAMTHQVIVINDGTNALAVFLWPGDSLNGIPNASQSVPAGSVGLLLKIDDGVTQGWRGTVLS